MEGMITSWNQQRRQIWREHTQGHGQSGLTITAYCKEFVLHQRTFYLWRRRLESQSGHQTADASPVRFAVVEAASR